MTDASEKEKIEALKKIAAKDTNAKGVLSAIAARKKQPPEGRIHVNRVAERANQMGFEVSTPEAAAFLKEAADICGGKVTKIGQNYTYMSPENFKGLVSRAIKDLDVLLKEPAPSKKETKKTQEPSIPGDFTFTLKSGETARISIPNDLDPQDAEIIQVYIKARTKK